MCIDSSFHAENISHTEVDPLSISLSDCDMSSKLCVPVDVQVLLENLVNGLEAVMRFHFESLDLEN